MEVDMFLNEGADEEEAVVIALLVPDWKVKAPLADDLLELLNLEALHEGVN